MPQPLPTNLLVNVTVSVAQAAAQSQNTTTLLCMTPNALIDTNVRTISFATLTAVGAFFGTAGMEYAVAQLWFALNSKPIVFGRWAQTASYGQLVGAPLTPAQQAIANFQGTMDGGFTIQVDQVAAKNVVGINLTAAQNLNAVAADISAALVAAGVGASCLWNGTNFVFTSATNGALSAVAFLTPPTGAGVTDLSALLGAEQASSGSYVAPGLAAETALSALTTLDNLAGSTFYAVVCPNAQDLDHSALSGFCQSSATKHFYFSATMEAGVLVPVTTTDLASVLSALGNNHTAVQYSSTSPYSVVSLASRMLAVNYSGTKTVINPQFQAESGVVAETLSVTQLNSVLQKNCNVYVNYQGGAQIIQPGTTCANGQYIDSVIGLDNLAIEYNLAIFNALLQAGVIALTDSGMHQLLAAGEVVLQKYVANGLLAPGNWIGSQLFGALTSNYRLTKGYYSYAAPVSSLTAAQIGKRMAVPIQVAVNLANAINNVSGVITVNP